MTLIGFSKPSKGVTTTVGDVWSNLKFLPDIGNCPSCLNFSKESLSLFLDDVVRSP